MPSERYAIASQKGEIDGHEIYMSLVAPVSYDLYGDWIYGEPEVSILTIDCVETTRKQFEERFPEAFAEWERSMEWRLDD